MKEIDKRFCMHGFPAFVSLAILASGFVEGTMGAPQQGSKPNILLITTDQQFADAMSCVDSEWISTPAMDSIAKKGVRFTRAYVNYPVCMPSRYSIYTGRLPGQRHFADAAHKPEISLGNQARKQGYRTAYFGLSLIHI